MKKNFYKMAVKAFAVTAMLLSAAAAQAVEYFQRLSMEGVELIGAVTWGKVDEFTLMQPGYYEFSYDRKFSPDKTAPLFKATPMGGCAYHDGKIYSCEYSELSHKIKPVWRIYDAKTFKLLSEHTLKDNCESTTTCITYDQTTGNIYGLLETYDETFLVKVNPETGDMTRIGSLLDHLSYTKYLAIACSPTGVIYCTYLNKSTNAIYLGKFRKTTGQVSAVSGISATNLLPGDSFINGAYEQAMFFNNATGKLYWMFQGSSAMLYKEVTQIYEVDPLTADAVMVAYTEDELQGPGAFFLEPSLEAPAIISDFAWTPDEPGSESGTISFTLPTKTYGDNELKGSLTLNVTNGDETFFNGEATPGEKFSKHVDNMPNKWNELSIQVSNSAGDGPKVKRSFFAGYDTPKAPTNVKLVADGLRTTLSWDAPTEGINGYTINKEDLTYKVVRYPGEVTVAENLKDCSFSEEHPGDMTRYVYTVTPYANKKEGKVGMSNNLIVGTPLDVPYGGEFNNAYDMYNYYTIIDKNADGYTWMYDDDTNRAYYHYSMANAADDWMISPAINYKKGKTYELTFTAYSSSYTYKEDMEVTFGNDKTVDAQNELLLKLLQLPTVDEADAPSSYSAKFTVPEDGVYYFAFHAMSEKFREYIFLYNISVKEVATDGISRMPVGADTAIAVDNGVLSVSSKTTTSIKVTDLGGRTVVEGNGKNMSAKLSNGIYLVNISGKTVKTVVK